MKNGIDHRPKVQSVFSECPGITGLIDFFFAEHVLELSGIGSGSLSLDDVLALPLSEEEKYKMLLHLHEVQGLFFGSNDGSKTPMESFMHIGRIFSTLSLRTRKLLDIACRDFPRDLNSKIPMIEILRKNVFFAVPLHAYRPDMPDSDLEPYRIQKPYLMGKD